MYYVLYLNLPLKLRIHLHILIIGGGIAGISAAWRLRNSGCDVTIIEARSFLGGRLCSYADRATGTPFDNGPHLFLSSYRATRALLKDMGIAESFTFPWLNSIPFRDSSSKKIRLHFRPMPAPWNLAAGLLTFPLLSGEARRRTVLTAHKLLSEAINPSLSAEKWLDSFWQNEERRIFWDPLIHATLNTSARNVSIRDLQTVIKEGFCKGLLGGRLGYAQEPLGTVFNTEVGITLEDAGIKVITNAKVTGITTLNNRITGVILKDGQHLECNAAVIAVPPWSLGFLQTSLPSYNTLKSEYKLDKWQPNPISSLYLWSDKRPIFDAFTCLPGQTAEWLFDFARIWGNRQAPICLLLGNIPEDHLKLDEKNNQIERIIAECTRLFPELKTVRWKHRQFITENRATPLRPSELWGKALPQTTPLNNMFLAGDWLNHLPPTVEAAVRSGERAAGGVLKKK
ncbi:hypothetical protein CEE37_01535 [candidate division LCP-89 bacterium B3_LCP]|uniref:Amine oxidase domain-containing protein n=1 Tax=candidate division LCP-89 bacterium B3_LCP TaxID=2012998 RepID=A0A532V5C9_UNCL8|nr:MAG: hypothetical protein CEE37_01535 [candidate division LCP-89 bacterium B3_LCP]